MTSSSLPLYNRTLAWLKLIHDPIVLLNIPSGRIIMDGFAPAVDDFTQLWGACQIQTIPRHYDVMRAQLDYFSNHSIRYL
jgi:hypothetical protein